jgi:transporter family-2 protein
MFILAIILSFLAGAAIVISRIINAALAARIGILPGTLFNYITGLIVSILFFILTGSRMILDATTLTGIPIWAYMGGLVGVIVVTLSSYLTPRIPVFRLTLLMFIGQMAASLIIDWIILGAISPGKLIGSFLVLAGLSQNIWVERTTLIADTKKQQHNATASI